MILTNFRTGCRCDLELWVYFRQARESSSYRTRRRLQRGSETSQVREGSHRFCLTGYDGNSILLICRQLLLPSLGVSTCLRKCLLRLRSSFQNSSRKSLCTWLGPRWRQSLFFIVASCTAKRTWTEVTDRRLLGLGGLTHQSYLRFHSRSGSSQSHCSRTTRQIDRQMRKRVNFSVSWR